jgi:hypothetical protein
LDSSKNAVRTVSQLSQGTPPGQFVISKKSKVNSGQDQIFTALDESRGFNFDFDQCKASIGKKKEHTDVKGEIAKIWKKPYAAFSRGSSRSMNAHGGPGVYERLIRAACHSARSVESERRAKGEGL